MALRLRLWDQQSRQAPPRALTHPSHVTPNQGQPADSCSAYDVLRWYMMVRVLLSHVLSVSNFIEHRFASR